MGKNESGNGERKRYYISVQASQILEDQQASSYELVADMNEEEHFQLSELFDELSKTVETEAYHFSTSPYGTASDEEINAGYDGLLKQIYAKLYECGTKETRQHIESMHIL